jgi:general L-amino acid transport system permease protein
MSTSFVRSEMLPQQTPPASQRGALKWLRENLFSGWFNTILTLLAFAAIYWLIMASVPWLSNSIWNAGSLRECRDMVIAQSGPDATGACWAMVRVRWNQFLFGLSPVAEYWRPTTAFALMFVALAPVLYYGLKAPSTKLVAVIAALALLALTGLGTDGTHLVVLALILVGLIAVAWLAPKRLAIVTLLFPLVAFFLLWGGSIWGPIGSLLGFAIFGLVWWIAQRKVGVVVAAAIALIVAAIWWIGGPQTAVTTALHSMMPIELPYVRSDDFGGFLLAFVIGITGITASLPFGILLALGRQSPMTIVKAISVSIIEFFRGVPLITVLFAANFMLLYFLPPRTHFDLILRVVIVVVIFASAYIAEVVRGGLAALPRGQYEAADALGLDYWQAQRLIIMPQALKISIPGIVSSFIGLFKDTTLVALVGLMDPLQGVTKIVRSDTAWKGIYWEPYIFVGAIFFVVCFSMSRYSMYLEGKLKTDHR